jgi:hypothetical protein
VIQVQISKECNVTADPQFTFSTIWSDGEELEHTGILTADDPKWGAELNFDGTPPTMRLEPYGPLNPNEEPVYGTTVLGAEDFYEEMVIGGAINLGETGDTAFQGFIQSNPHLCFEIVRGAGDLWLQTMFGAGDPALILVDPRNRWWYNDDAGAETWVIAPNGFDVVPAPVSSDDLNPLLRLSDPPQGRYCVWLATMTGEHHNTHLRISLLP